MNLVLDLVLIPPYGMAGAAAAWAVAIVVGNLVPLTQLYATMRLHPFGRGTLVAGALAIACFGVPPVLAGQVFGASLPVLAVVALLGAVGYAAGAWRWRSLLQLDALRRTARRGGSERSGGVQHLTKEADEGG